MWVQAPPWCRWAWLVGAVDSVPSLGLGWLGGRSRVGSLWIRLLSRTFPLFLVESAACGHLGSRPFGRPCTVVD